MVKKSKNKVVSLEARRKKKKKSALAKKKSAPVKKIASSKKAAKGKNQGKNLGKNQGKSQGKSKNKKPFSREKAWEDYHGLIKWVSSSIAAKCRHFVTTEDLVSVGAIGLLKAMDMFDPKKNTQFRTYAVIKIRGEILDYIRKNYPRPVSQQIKGRDYVQMKEQLQTKFKREPTIEEIAKALDVTIEEAHTMADMAKQVQFVDWDSVAERGKSSTSDLSSAYDSHDTNVFVNISRKQIREQLQSIMAEMPDKVAEVLQFLYFEDLSQIEVATRMDLSPSRVSQLHSEGISILQEQLSNNLVAEALQVA